jgi:putative oxidoreductase
MTVIDQSRRGPIKAMRDLFVMARGWLENFPLSIIQLAMRIAVGAVFFKSGLLKIRSWEFAIKLFEEEYKVPWLDPVWAAGLATLNELTFPVLLFTGLATRLSTLPLLGMILVIQTFIYPQAWTEHLLWSSILLFLLARGPGALSLDHLIEQRYRIRKIAFAQQQPIRGSSTGPRC